VRAPTGPRRAPVICAVAKLGSRRVFPSLTLARRWRTALLYAALATVLAGAFVVLLVATLRSLEQRGITTGYGFLSRAAGFDIGFKLIPYEASDTYARAFMVGLTNTLFVSALAAAGGTVLGVSVGLLRLSRSLLMKGLAASYVELLRNCPLLLHLFIWYFGALSLLPGPRQTLAFGGDIFLNNRGLFFPLPKDGLPLGAATLGAALAVLLACRLRGRMSLPLWLRYAGMAGLWLTVVLVLATVIAQTTFERPRVVGLNLSGGGYLTPELIALFLALSLYSSSFIAEIVRGGILAVDVGQQEAAMALGLSRWKTIRLVVFPQALRIIIPPLTNQYVNVVKLSSLAAAIAYPDLMQVFGKTTLNQTGQAVEVITLTMAVYLAISLSTSAALQLFSSRLVLQGRAA